MVRLASAVPSAMVAVSTPHVAYDYAKGNIDNVKKHFSKVFKFISFLAFPMSLGLIAVADNFSSWFYGSNFVGIEKLIIAGAILIISLAWSHLLGNMILIATGNQKYYTIGVYVGAGLNLCMNIFLIPKLGALGALLASDVAEISGMIIMFYFSNKIFSLAYNLKYIIVYFFASLIMASVIVIVNLFLPYGALSTFGEIVIGMLVYALVLAIFKDESLKDMVILLRKIVKKISS
jgi:O-antigen/teichoic acid export membrane protein